MNETNPMAQPNQAPASPPLTPESAQPTEMSSEANSGPKLWGRLTRFIDGPLTFAAWAFGAEQEPGIAIYSPQMSACGTVIANISVTVAN